MAHPSTMIVCGVNAGWLGCDQQNDLYIHLIVNYSEWTNVDGETVGGGYTMNNSNHSVQFMGFVCNYCNK